MSAPAVRNVRVRRARALVILDPGPLTTLQDLGRPGWAHLGVTASGAADLPSLALANRLVGNPEHTAALETTYGGLRVRIDARGADGAPGTVWAALTGAPCPAALDGRPLGMDVPFAVADGQVLALGAPVAGLRTYLAVRGGPEVPATLGSRSTDLLSGLGPAPLAAGDVLPLAPPGGAMPGVDLAPRAALPRDFVLRVVPGPRDDWFDAAAVAALYGEVWTATSRSNRVGVRLAGPVLGRARAGELPAEGMVRGALQVPPNGQPILFLADHPVTGGYPVIGVVHAADLPLAGQLPPGAAVRFRKPR
ncbi:5-oxoprolinase subunit C family protein [Streptomyces paludis]|uniref:Allophanate hydrolase subunit 2 family protein n=1 Tax=Streptomyces paludis TaxID=2282738 RepID=A0A345HTN1_9ACTN|nr:biotin-dependent carboxyltransferase family protein [Streptomyces paludis]AXG80055.1 allophanate hydrolase subunit 2 family protein [Streptomyces paludis]